MNDRQQLLLPSTATHPCSLITESSKQYLLNSIVGITVALPFALTAAKICFKESLPIGIVLAVEGTLSIFRVGYIFYGQHVMELFYPQEAIAHIAGHLQEDNKTELPSWSIRQKMLAATLIMACTLPLGITKIALHQDSSSAELYEKSLYLVFYSAIDALPHVNHLPLWRLAFNKFLSLPWYCKAWVLLLMTAHGLNDVADIWNTQGMLTYWIYLGLIAEFFISAVEAVAHYRPESLKFDAVSMINMLVIMLGALNIALLNWYNSFGTLTLSLGSTSKLLFVLLQSLTTLFFAFEVWNHSREEGCDHHDHHAPMTNQDNTNPTPNFHQCNSAACLYHHRHYNTDIYCPPINPPSNDP